MVMLQPIVEDVEPLGSVPISVKFVISPLLFVIPYHCYPTPPPPPVSPLPPQQKCLRGQSPPIPNTSSPDALPADAPPPGAGLGYTYSQLTMTPCSVSWRCRFTSPPMTLPALHTPMWGTTIYYRIASMGASLLYILQIDGGTPTGPYQ